jgi:Fe2+ transport system protein FeoA
MASKIATSITSACLATGADDPCETTLRKNPKILVAIASHLIELPVVKLAVAKDLEIDSAMTLNQARVGCDLQIQVLSGPGCERLRDMGFCEQMQVRKLTGGRNLICSVCGTRLAISSDLAEQVLVKIAS